MSQPIRILALAPSGSAHAACAQVLHGAGLLVELHAVDSLAGVHAALDDRFWDILLADAAVAEFDLHQLTDSLRASGSDAAVLLLADGASNDFILHAMRHGVRDVLGSAQLPRLPLVVLRELDEVRGRRQLRQVRQQLEHLHATDTLTGVANSDACIQHLRRRIERGEAFSLAVLDLTRFSHISQSLGPLLAQQVLRQVAQRLAEALPALAGATDAPLVARLGADRFALVSNCCAADDRLAECWQAMLQPLTKPVQVESHTLLVRAAMGVAAFPAHAGSPDELLRAAEAALDEARRAGPMQARVFHPGMGETVRAGLEMLPGLLHALHNDGFALHYQPQFETVDGRARVRGFEALLRWSGDEPPARFIPLLESSGLMLEVGDWVLRTASRQLAQWHAAGWPDLHVAVNISAVQFRHPGFLDSVRSALAESGVPVAALELEITESMAMEHHAEALRTIDGLRELGVRLAIDDFGTGYSSLAYLQQFPVHRLKIDQRFVRNETAGGGKIAAAIVAMGQSLGLSTLAEGVETAEQAARLQALGCMEVQGYHFARPMPAANVLSFLYANCPRA